MICDVHFQSQFAVFLDGAWNHDGYAAVALEVVAISGENVPRVGARLLVCLQMTSRPVLWVEELVRQSGPSFAIRYSLTEACWSMSADSQIKNRTEQ